MSTIELQYRESSKWNIWNDRWMEVRSFLEPYYRLVRETLGDHKRTVALLLMLSILSGICQGVVLLVVVRAVQFVDPSTHAAGMLKQWSVAPEITLFVFGTLILGLGATGAYGTWKSTLLARRVARKVQEGLAISMLNGLASASPLELSLSREQSINPYKPLTQGALILSVAVESVITSVHPIILILSVVISVMWMDWQVALVAALVVMLPLPMVYVLNRQTHRVSARFYGKEREEATKELTSLVKGAISGGLPENELPEISERYIGNTKIRDSLDDYDFFKLANQRSTFINSLFRSIGISGGFILFCWAAIQGWLSWGVIVGSLLAIFRVQQAAGTVLSCLTTLVRFAPVVNSTLAFKQKLAAANQPLEVKSAVIPLRSTRDKFKKLLLIADLPLQRTTVHHLLNPLINGDLLQRQNCQSLAFYTHQDISEIQSQSTSIHTSDFQTDFLSRTFQDTALVLLPAKIELVKLVDDLLSSAKSCSTTFLFVTDCWEDEIHGFDRVVLLEGENIQISEEPQWWETRRDLLRTNSDVVNSDDLALVGTC